MLKTITQIKKERLQRLLVIFFVLNSSIVSAQWHKVHATDLVLGQVGFNLGTTDYPNVAIDALKTSSVAYQDYGNSDITNVIHYKASSDVTTTITNTIAGNPVIERSIVYAETAINANSLIGGIAVTKDIDKVSNNIEANTAPTFTSTPITSVNEGDTYSYTITTNDIDGDLVGVTATTLPSWLSLTTESEVSTLAGIARTSGSVNGTGTAASFKAPTGVAVDGSGTIYVADKDNHLIRKITPTGMVTTLAGSGSSGSTNGTGTAASFNNPTGVAVDASGTIYVADYGNYLIRKITPAGEVSTLAGSGSRGSANGTGTAASFRYPTGVAVDASGYVYVADTYNHLIRKITPTGVVTTLAGSGSSGSANGTGTAASFKYPTGVAVDGSGNLYVADYHSYLIRKITPTGVVSTLAGSGSLGSANGTGTAASFRNPSAVAVDGSGTIYVADANNHSIRKITPTGMVTTLAGSGSSGSTNGTGTAARFYYPRGVTVDASGYVYVADQGNHLIRKIRPVITLTGDSTGQVGDHPVVLEANDDGNGGTVQQSFTITVNDVTPPIFENSTPTASNITRTSFTLETDINEAGNIYYVVVSDGATAPSTVEVKAGTGSAGTTPISSGNATVTTSGFTHNFSISSLTAGTKYNVYVVAEDDEVSNNIQASPTKLEVTTTANTAPTFTSTPITSVNEGDTYSYTIITNDTEGDDITLTATTLPSWLSLTTDVEVSTLAGSGNKFESKDGTGTSASFFFPTGVAVDGSGAIYVADTGSHLIRKITPAGVVTTLAGSESSGSANGTGTSASFKSPNDVAVDVSGTIYVADTNNHLIRKITPTGVVTTLAGSGSSGSADGTGTSASFNYPTGVAVDASKNVYVADEKNHLIRKITPTGVVTTLAGIKGSSGSTNGTGTSASFKSPSGVAVDGSRNVYVADRGNHLIRKITPTGVVTTLAGSGSSGSADGTGTSASFKAPYGVGVDGLGSIYVADSNNNLIRKITPTGVVTTLAGSGSGGNTNGSDTVASFNYPAGVAVDASGTVYVVGLNSHLIRKITPITLTGDSTGQVGDHPVVLEANDGNGSTVQQSFSITVSIAPSTQTDIIAYSFSEQTKAATIDSANHTIAIEVASGTDLSNLVASFSLSTGATATISSTTQTSGTTANDFSNPVTYTITAEDSTTTQDWVVSVSVAVNPLNDFVTTWKTDNAGTSGDTEITIPTHSGSTYNYEVDWDNDGTFDQSNITGNVTHNFSTAGTYTIRIRGTFPRIFFNNSGDKKKLIRIDQWGNNPWTSMENAFRGCEKLTTEGNDAPNLTNVNSLNNTFRDCSSFNSDLSNWDVGKVTNMSYMFNYASVFNQDLNNWNTSSVKNMSYMFNVAVAFNGNISNWDVSKVTNMTRMFAINYAFNQDLNNWNTSSVTNMNYMFYIAGAFNGNISNWNVSKVTNMQAMFNSAKVFNQDISNWNTSNVTTMSSMFGNANAFNANISNWDVSKVTNMYRMFLSAFVFNQDIGNWDTSKVTNMSGMFFYTTVFNQDLDNWDTSSVTNMSDMFNQAKAFNSNVSGWNVSKVTHMGSMFNEALVFNQDISNWDTSKVTNMENMFRDATAFNQNLGNWDLSSVVRHLYNMLSNSGLSTANYDATLTGWANNANTPNSLTFGATGLTYCNAVAARTTLDTTKNWYIYGDTECYRTTNDFVFTIKTDNTGSSSDTEFTIPTHGSTYNYQIDWDNDGTFDQTGVTGSVTHDFGTAGTYTIRITGTFPRIYFNNGGDKEKLIRIDQWGNNPWTSMDRAFYGCANLTTEGDDAPNLTNVTTLASTFRDCRSFNSDLSNWNTSSVKNMSYMFYVATAFNGDISSWDVSKVTNMTRMFGITYAFNQDLNNWNTSSVTNMNYMFYIAGAFNSNISNWNVSKVTNMQAMFNSAKVFNQDISNWNTSNVTTMSSMFGNANAFNANISNWDVSKVTNMYRMFLSAFVFNQDIGNWDTSKVTNMSGMFFYTTVFNQDLDNWDTSSVTNMSDMFNQAKAFNSNVSGWNVSKVTHMGSMFNEALVFNQDISNWDTSKVTNMENMFRDATAFNQNLGNWDLSSVVRHLYNMLSNSGLSTANYDATLTGWANNANTPNSLTFGATGLTYCNAVAARTTLDITKDWYIYGDKECHNPAEDFVITIKTDNTGISSNTEFIIPTHGGSTYSYEVDWNNDGTFDQTGITGDVTHDFVAPGTYTIRITGTFPRIYFNNALDKEKLIRIDQWGNNPWTSMEKAFYGCVNLTTEGNDAPNLTNVDNLNYTFEKCSSFNSDLSNWDTSTIKSLYQTFKGASAFNGDVTTWDTSEVKDMRSTFADAVVFNQDLSNWNTGNVTKMGALFYNAKVFNANISSWDVSKVTHMGSTFSYATAFNQDLGNWNTGKVTNMSNMFFHAKVFNGNISNWDVSKVTDMSSMFGYALAFNQNLDNWNTSSVTNMYRTFWGAQAFNGNLSSWDVSKVTNMKSMFAYATVFNQDLNNWDTSKVTNMEIMFDNAKAFNGNISSWDVSKVTDMESMFSVADVFNQDISSWNVSNVVFMTFMFSDATTFNQSLANWNLQSVTHFHFMLDNSGLSQTNYDATLTAWANNVNTPNNLTLGATGLTYCNAVAARTTLDTTKGWTINGDTQCYIPANDFVITIKTDNTGTSSNTEFTIPTRSSSTYNYQVDWDNDGTFDQTDITGDVTHNFTTAGTYTIRITGTFPRIYFNNSGDKEKLIRIDQWGNNPWTSMENAFRGCENLTTEGDDAPNLTNVDNLNQSFQKCSSFNSDLSNWDTGTITKLNYTFTEATVFNGDITTWDVSKVTDMSSMFSYAIAFNQDLSNWNASSVTTMFAMFRGATVFNSNISNWDVSKVTNMYIMFSYTSAFNQDISNWNTSEVTSMRGMFNSATAFNQNIGDWNTSEVTNMSYMFNNSTAFNQDIGNWNLSSATNLGNMLNNSGLSTANYDATLTGWANNANTPNNLALGATGLTYCNAETDRQSLIDTKSWTITGDSRSCNHTDITAFSFTAETGTASINATNHTVAIEVAHGTDVSNLAATFSLSTGASASINSVSQTSGTTANDFSNPVSYTVTAEDGTTTQDWVVTVSIAPSTQTDIIAYSFAEQTKAATIDPANHTIAIEVANGTDLSNLVASFSLSTGATATIGSTTQTNGTTTNDFSNPLTYTITAEDSTTTQDWVVTVSDVTPPIFENSTPTASSITRTSFTLETDINEAGNIYYVVVPDGATAPTSAKVKSGTASGGAIPISSGNTTVTTSGFTHNFNISSLTAGTKYDVYVVAEDDESSNNIQASPTKLEVATLNITFEDITKTYGDADFDLNATSNSSGAISYSIIGTDNGTSLSGTNNETVTLGNVATVTIRATQAQDGIYSAATKDITLRISPRPITITADAKSKVYGESDPSLTYQITIGSLVNTDVLSGNLGRTTGEDVGVYAIAQGNIANTNYDITFVADDLTISKAVLTATADDKSKTQGQVNPPLTITYTGFLGSDTIADIDTEPSISTTATIASAAGDYPITLAGGTDNNYSFNLVNGTLTVGSLTSPTITFNDINKTYGDADFNVNATSNSSGAISYSMVGNDNGTSLSGTNNQTVTLGNVASVTIRATQAQDGIYSAATKDIRLNISPRPITITADAKSKVYGESDPSLTYQITTGSLVNTDVLSGNLGRTTGEDVGVYAIAQGSIANTNYDITFVADDLTISKAVLTATADNKNKIQGQTNQVLTISYTGFVGTDAIADIDTEPSISTTATTASAVGDYPITLAGGTDNNYSFNLVDGTLTVGSFTSPTITFNDINKTYGDADFNVNATSNSSGAISYSIAGNNNGTSLSGTNNEIVTLGNVATVTIRATQAQDGIYSAATKDITLSISPRPITITADAKSKMYGVADPILTYQITTGSLVGTDALTGTLGRAPGEDVGTYTINQGSVANGNYAITFVNDDLGITKALLIATADNKNKVQGQTNPALTISYTGFVNGDIATVIDSEPSISTTATTASAAGNYPITLAGGTDNNYSFNLVDGTLTVGSLTTPTITFNDINKTYGDADFNVNATSNSSGAISYSIVGNDNGTSLSGTNNETVTLGNAASVTIRASQVQDGIYSASTKDITLSISPRPISITADAKSKVYGEADPTLTYQITTGSLVTSDVLSGNLGRTTGEDVGVYAIAQGSIANTNYDITFVADDLTISKAVLTATADNKNKIQGQTNQVLTISYTGFVGTDAIADIDTEPSISTTATTASAVGDYPITLAGGTDNNYSFNLVDGTLTVGSFTSPTITFNDINKTYGDADFNVNATSNSSGAISYSIAGNNNGTSLSGTNNETVTLGNVATVTIRATQAQDGIYSAATKDITLRISPRPITITADAKSKVYGESDPSLTYQITTGSLVNTDVLSGNLGRTTGEDVGMYAINQGSVANGNYAITFVSDDLGITKALLTATADDKSKIQGQANPALTIGYTGFVNGDTATVIDSEPSISTTATTASAAGNYPITLAVGTDNNYSFNLVNGTLTVGSLTSPTITFNDINKTYSDADFNVNATSNSSGAISYSIIGTNNGTSLSGTNNETVTLGNAASVTIRASQVQDGIYSASTKDITVSISPRPISITADAKSKVYGEADPTLTYQITTGSLVTSDVLSGNLGRTTGEDVGVYAIAQGSIANTNYDITFVADDLTISKAVLTATADDKNKVQGQVNPALTISYTGFVGTDAIADIDTEPIISTTATTTSTAGNYPITLAVGTDNNYSFNLVNGTLTVGSLTSPIITFNDINKTYGDADFNVNATSNSSGAISYSIIGTDNGTSLSGTNNETVTLGNAASVTIRASQVQDGIYSASTKDITLSISPRPISITADAKSKVYGEADPTLTYQITIGSLVNTDVLSGNLGRTTGEDVGVYAIAQGSIANTNYDITFVGDDLTISKAIITATADNKNKVQGQTNPALTISYTGFVGTDAIADIDTEPSISTTATTASTAGDYPITLAGGTDNNYSFNLVDGTLTVGSFTSPTITFNDINKTYGDADFNVNATSNSSGAISYSIVGNDNGTSLSGTNNQTVTLGNVATVTIRATQAQDGIYSAATKDITLSISPRPITITADAISKVYGEADPFTYQITEGSLVGTDALSGTLGRAPGEDVGTYAINQGSVANSNYDLSFVANDLSITKALLTATAGNKNKIQGQTNPAFTITYTGFVGTDAIADIDTEPSISTTATTASAAGDYPITLAGGTDNNYSFNLVNGTLTVGSFTSPTITFNDINKTYGDADFNVNATSNSRGAISYSMVGVTNGTSLSGTNNETVTLGNVATVTIRATQAQDGIYSAATKDITLSISPRPITITADAKSKMYGVADPILTYQITTGSLVNTDVLSGNLGRATGEDVGMYAINQGNVANTNYDITFVANDLSITKALLTATADNKNKIQGQANPVLTISYTGFVGTDAIADIDTEPSISTTATIASAAGDYPITLAGGTDNNYSFNLVDGTLTVGSLTSPTITFNDITKTYGDADFNINATSNSNGAISYSIIGTNNGTSLSGTNNETVTLGNVANVTIRATQAQDGIYSASTKDITVSISRRPITVTADAKSKIYGASDPSLTYQITIGSLVNTDVLSGNLGRTTGEDVGVYAIAQGSIANTNYDITFVADDLTISKAVLTATADDKNKIQEQTNPVLTISYTGFVGTDAIADIDTEPSISTTATIASAAGNYPITLAGGTDNNYSFNLVNSTLIVGSFTSPTITFNDINKTYGDVDFNVNATSNSSGTISYSIVGVDNGTSLSGTNNETVTLGNVATVTIRATQAQDGIYSVSTKDITVRISPRPITITADAKSKIYGVADPILTYQITTGSLVGTDAFTGTLGRAPGEDVGTYAINQGSVANSNYDITFVSDKLSITPKKITITAEAITKDYGIADPVLTYTVSPSLELGDTLIGDLERDTGENIGVYTIHQGTLENLNYTIIYIAADFTISIPENYEMTNIFTPDNDGINDLFAIKNLEKLYPNFEIIIYNRRGVTLFNYKHTGNPDDTPNWWDGVYKGRKLPTSVYYYYLNFNDNKTKPKSTWVYLER